MKVTVIMYLYYITFCLYPIQINIKAILPNIITCKKLHSKLYGDCV